MNMGQSWGWGSKCCCAVVLQMSRAPGSHQSKFLALLWWLIDMSSLIQWLSPLRIWLNYIFQEGLIPALTKTLLRHELLAFSLDWAAVHGRLFPRWLPGKDPCSSLPPPVFLKSFFTPNWTEYSANTEDTIFLVFFSEWGRPIPSPMSPINAFPRCWHFLWFWASVIMDLSWAWENSSPPLTGLPPFFCKIRELSCVKGTISIEAQS